jgi:hypothetical protein
MEASGKYSWKIEKKIISWICHPGNDGCVTDVMLVCVLAKHSALL